MVLYCLPAHLSHSADLWVQTNTSIAGAFNSTASSKIDYASDSVSGADMFANVTIGGFNITNQVYSGSFDLTS
jgi:hypothetical protein